MAMTAEEKAARKAAAEAKKQGVQVSQEIFDLLNSNSFTKEPIYAEEKHLFSVPADKYVLTDEVIEGYGKPFTVTKATFLVNGVEKEITVKPRVKIDEDDDIRVALFKATRSATFKNGVRSIAIGDKVTYCLQ